MSFLRAVREEIEFAVAMTAWGGLSLVEWRVAPKARKLDRVNPGWYQKVNLSTLDGRNDHRCVLGQVYGDYQDAPRKLQGLFGCPTLVYCFRDKGWNKAVQKRRERDWIKSQPPTPLGNASTAVLAKLYSRNRVEETVEIEEEEWS